MTTLNLLKGYWQIPLTEHTKKLSAFVTPEGLYLYRVMPFGMENALTTFQRMINQIVRGIEGCKAYIDNVIVNSDSWKGYISQLRALLSRLSEAHLTMNLSKSEFGHAQVKFLGYTVRNGQVMPVHAKVHSVVNYPIPKNKQELMQFLGMAGYYRCLCHNFSMITAPLTNLLKKNQKYEWSSSYQAAFQQVKLILTSRPILIPPDFQKPFLSMVNAGDIGAGTVLM